MERYQVGKGQEISYHEMFEAFKRITGRPIPQKRSRDFAQAIMQKNPLRWEFEINRCRGFAWDNGEGLA